MGISLSSAWHSSSRRALGHGQCSTGGSAQVSSSLVSVGHVQLVLDDAKVPVTAGFTSSHLEHLLFWQITPGLLQGKAQDPGAILDPSLSLVPLPVAPGSDPLSSPVESSSLRAASGAERALPPVPQRLGVPRHGPPTPLPPRRTVAHLDLRDPQLGALGYWYTTSRPGPGTPPDASPASGSHRPRLQPVPRTGLSQASFRSVARPHD